MVLLICHSFIYLTERIFGKLTARAVNERQQIRCSGRHRMLIQAGMAEVKTALRAKGII